MTEGRAQLLVYLAGALATVVGILGLSALGVRGIGITFGGLVPLLVTASASARVVMRYGDEADRHRKH
jgi:hypothetical protein